MHLGVGDSVILTFSKRDRKIVIIHIFTNAAVKRFVLKEHNRVRVFKRR